MKTLVFKFCLFLSLGFCLTPKANAQGTVPDISILHLINFPDTAYEGQSYQQIGITFYNNDSLSYAGNIVVFIIGDSSLVDTLYTSSQVTIAANDSTTFFTNTGFQFDPGTFRAGSNIVVVWPVANGVLQTDSLFDNVFYVRTSSVTPVLTGIESFDAYPNPANKFLGFILPSKSIAESVRISDMYGRIVYEHDRLFQKHIDVSTLKQGYYFVVITDTKGKRFLTKVLKY
ncbi:MAG TPA: T9SS type A sorting domain-containing protein [Bacteroidia bacterium]|nr:T9SS type A sorting domain-containing protein [Bacteroidia bacterium]HNU33254.1 T9SS type A sorting domain-containing protein [Bacteroidia bacterium]